MPRGRRPTPTHLRIIRGNPQHRPLPTGEPKAPKAAIEMPPWLRALDAAASGIGEWTVAQLRDRAKTLGLRGLARATHAQLVEAIAAADPGPRELAWSELAPMLGDMRIATSADVPALAMVVDAYVDYIEIRLELADKGATYSTSGRYGVQVKRRPQFEMATKRWEQVRAGLIEFGLTPASRSKVAVAPQTGAAEDEFDSLTSGGAG